MFRRLLCLVSFIAIPISFCAGQNDWREGYIINTSGDTLNGLIDYRSSSSNSKICYFKSNINDMAREFNPTELVGYRYKNSKYFISKTLTLAGIPETYFVEFLIKGKANIYFLKTDTELYFLEIDNQIIELKNSTEIKYKEGRDFLVEKKEYIGLLNYYLKEAKLQSEIKSSRLENKSLITIARKYHESVCENEECIVYEKQTKKITFDAGLMAGFSNKTLELTQSLDYTLNPQPAYFGGITIKMGNIPIIYERFSLKMDVLVSKYYMENRPRYYINVPFAVSYRLTVKKFYPEIDAGFSSYFIKNSFAQSKHMTPTIGISINYQCFNDKVVFLKTSLENNPRTVRLSAGFLF